MLCKDLMERTAWQCGASVDEVERVVGAFVQELAAALRSGEHVDVPGLGRFAGLGFIPADADDHGAADVAAGWEAGVAPRDS
jgi:hypothetical protein